MTNNNPQTVSLTNKPSVREVELKLISYNMHGFNQGSHMLSSLFDDVYCPDILFVQEHWLTPANMYKIKTINNKFTCYGISAMEQCVQESLLKGRPHGGVATLINSSLTTKVAFVKCCERFVILSLGNTLFINVYLPCVTANVQSKDALLLIIADIHDVIASARTVLKNNDLNIVIGGDLNVNLENTKAPAFPIIMEFINRLSLITCNSIIPGNLTYSYCHESLQQYSLIDYFLFKKAYSQNLTEYHIIDCPTNLSDHLPLFIRLSLPDIFCDCVTNTNVGAAPEGANGKIIHLDWIAGNKRGYYEATRVKVQPIYSSIESLHNRLKSVSLQGGYCKDFRSLVSPSHGTAANAVSTDAFIQKTHSEVEIVYLELCEALREASLSSIPNKRKNAAKYWWDTELNELKENSVKQHACWVDAGRPAHGITFNNKRNAKNAYKVAIRRKKSRAETDVSDNLHRLLLENDQQSFWKLWKSKFSQQSNLPKSVEGLTDQLSIANKFADYFAATCTPLPLPGDMLEGNDLHQRLTEYKGHDITFDHRVDVNFLSNIINQLGLGKASGADELSAEHLRYSHPVVAACLHKLFVIFTMCDYVPDAFGKGIVIPLPKHDTRGAPTSVGDFRGITISPVISKVFELCLLEFIRPYLASSEAQFGFKKGYSCSHAIYTVRKVIDNFTMNNSTVNLCALDISKAFDRVNHSKLFSKLMDSHVPLKFIILLQCWYSKSFISVRWAFSVSKCVKLMAGVRQGSVLGPHLFSFYVNNLLAKLRSSGLGCHIKSLCFNAIMYADDLLLLSISITHMQLLINMSNSILTECGLQLNSSKTACIRIGNRHQQVNSILQLNNSELEWHSQLRYLGMYILSARTFKCNLQSVRHNFYRAANNILGKVKSNNNPAVVLSLTESFCTPVLLYGLEALNMSAASSNAIDFAYNSVFCKVFNVKESITISVCQYHSGFLPASCLLDLRRLKFFNGLLKLRESLPSRLSQLTCNGHSEFDDIIIKYSLPPLCAYSPSGSKRAIWHFLKDKLSL